MTAAIASGLALALAASVALNTGFLLQHNGASDAPAVSALRPLATLASLLRRRVWLAGLLLGTAGWAMHVAALTRAPLSLVQAFVAGGLALLAPIAKGWFGHELKRSESVAVVVMAAGLAALALGVHASHHAVVPGPSLLIFLAGCAAAGGLLATRQAPSVLALAAGVLYGAADTAIKALTLVESRSGLAAAALSPWLVAAVLMTAGAFFAFQRALQLGRPVTSIALMTAATYAVSIAAGLGILDEPLGRGAIGVLHALSFAAVVAAAWVLAPIQARLTTP
jgi:drug/metabolite transporter (DMT)-like permease